MNSPPNHEWEEGLDIDDFVLLLTPVIRPTNNPHIVPEITTTQTLIPSQNHQVDTYAECEQALDIDDSDVRLTPVVRPSNNPHIVLEITNATQTLFSSQNNQVDNCVVKPIRIIPGPAGIVQTAKLCKLVDTRKGVEESVMSTQEYIRKVIEDVGEDDDFTRAPSLSAIDYVNVDGGIVMGCFRDVKKFLKNGKLEKIIADIKSCTPNALGDLTVTLKDLSVTISDTIHYKVLTEESFAKTFTVGSALILHNVFIFSPKKSTHHYLNITKKNMVKVFHKDGGSA
ncbi:hypothetical protein Tco_1113946 [Tanacetum coccineum]|uniref:Homologous recombination OB-fold protein OB-fold domain-containing protein n=1 Tax=Tanacetum coccineum TaxID=301880 RepID=A0ABQ5ITP0_9ASTR